MIEIIGHALSQWDVGRSVQITGIEADHAHFANKGDSKAVIMGVADTKAKIPDYLLQTGKQLCVYAVKDGITVESKTFYVQKRERPENYVYEDDQRNYIYELITSAETAVEDANKAANSATEATAGANASADMAKAAADSANEAAEKANAAAKAFGDIGKNFVKTVNGIAPDENGNVNVEGGGGGIAEETDPTVPEWAKQPNKPSYTAAEVGALPSSTVIPTVPSALKNPHALTFTGAVEATYDGSGPVSVVIPQPGSGGSGEPGADGFSPIATVTQTGSGAVISITDKSGTTTATVFNGKDGKDGYTPVKGVDYFDGAPGKDGNPGADGYTPVKGKDYFDGKDGQDGSPGKDGSDGVSATHSWNGTVLTVTSASGTSSADLKGATGNPGKDGSNGQPGADGVSPTVAVSKSGKVTTVAITDKNGTKTATINDGADGSPGSAGKDGTSVTVKSVSESTADGGSNVVTFSDGKTFTVKNGSKGSTGATGATGATGKNGADGYTPVRGTDYWTEADKVEIVQRVIESLGGNPIFGIVDENNNIIVSGDLPDGTYSVKYEMENGSKVNIGNLVIDTNVYYTVTNTLTQCTTNNSATKAVQGGSYSATITAKSGYELSSIVVKMGGTDISSTAVSGGKITIANVTGNIVITAVAEVAKPAYTNFADPTSADWKTGYRLTTNIDGVTALTGGVVTNYIPIQLGDTLAVEGINFTDGNDRTAFNGTNASIAKASVIKSTWVSGGYAENVSYDNNSLTLTITDKCTNTNKIRFSGTATGTSNDVVVKIKRNGEWL